MQYELFMSVNFVLACFDVSATLWLIVNVLQGYDAAFPGNGVPDLECLDK